MRIIKEYTLRKITVILVGLFILFIFNLVPTKSSLKIHGKENYVYLLDDDNYLSKVICYFDTASIEDEIYKRRELLTNKNSMNKFHSLIPSSTKLNSIRIDKNDVYLDFSKELLTSTNEEKMIESIVYTLSEINGIENIYINVEGKELRFLPNIKKEIPYPLNRSYGINKEYYLTSFDDIDETTIFFIKNCNDLKYLVPVTKITNTNEEKINIIINELKSKYNINKDVFLLNHYIDNNIMYLIFNDYIFNDSGILDDIKDVLKNSIFENYDVNKIIIMNEKNTIKIEINK